MATIVDDRSVSIGRVFSRTFGVMGDNPVVVFGISLLLSAIPQLLFNGLIRIRATQIPQPGFNAPAVEMGLLGLLVTIVLQSIVSGCMTRATVAYSQGERASLGDCLNVAIRRALPVIAVSVLAGLAMVIGLIFLVVPGVMLMVAWSVVIPVTVAEDVGIFGAFGRAARLTSGARWKIFGMFLLLILVFIAITMIVGTVAVLVIGGSPQSPALFWQPVAIVLSLVSATLSTAFFACNQTALFVELRNWKDGPMDTKLGDIFA